MKRVLKLTDAWSYSAETENLLHVAREMRVRGYDVTLACMPDTPIAKRAREFEIPTVLIKGLRPGPFVWRGIAAAGKFLRITRDLHPDLIHVYRSSLHPLAAWAARRAGVPLVRTRGNIDRLRTHAFNRWVYNNATARTIVTGEAVRQQMVRAGMLADRLQVIRGAVDPAPFDRQPWHHGRLRAQLQIPPDAPLVGCVARLAPIKGHSYLIEAFARLRESAVGSAAHLVLIGPAWGRGETALREQVARLHLDSFVHYLGKRDDVAACMRDFDVGVVSSVGSEALSRVTLEYMCAGVPVVATRVGTIAEILPDFAGRLVPPSDPLALAAALEEFLAAPDRGESFGRLGAEYVRREFTIHKQVDALEAIYASL